MLTNENGGNRSTVTISAKYVPVPIQLEMRETVNNTGVLRVDLLDGVGLKAADRNGKSDPYVAFYLNGEKVHESAVQKKTLNPKWNEKFEVLIPSRVGAKFTCKVMDWDRVGSSDRLGTGVIDVVEIEPFTAMTQTVSISDNGQAAGSINVRLVFRPEFVARSRAATSTFVGSVAGGAVHGVGAVAGTGLHVVGKGGKLALGGAGMVAGGAGAVGKGVFSGVKHVIPGHSRKSTMDSAAAAEMDQAAGQYNAAQGQARDEALPRTISDSGSRIASGVNGRFETSPVGGAPDFGSLTLTVTDFADLPGEDKLYCVCECAPSGLTAINWPGGRKLTSSPCMASSQAQRKDARQDRFLQRHARARYIRAQDSAGEHVCFSRRLCQEVRARQGAWDCRAGRLGYHPTRDAHKCGDHGATIVWRLSLALPVVVARAWLPEPRQISHGRTRREW